MCEDAAGTVEAAQDSALFESLYAGEVVREREEEAPASLVGRRLFVRGLPFDYGKNEIRALFSQFGEVERVETWKARRGSCVVDYREAKAASRALVGLDGMTLGRISLSITVERLFRDDGEDSEDSSSGGGGDDSPEVPLNFSGRGSKAEEERVRMVERKFKRQRPFCELCGRKRAHFAQGCFLLDKSYHRKFIEGEVEPPEEYARKLVEEERRREKEPPPAPPPPPVEDEPRPAVGRGRGTSLPSWMSNPELKAKALEFPPPEPRQNLEKPQHDVATKPPEEASSASGGSSFSRGSRRRRRRDILESDARRDMVAEWRQIVSTCVVWPLEDDGLYLKYEFEAGKLLYCRALPSGSSVDVDVTPPFDASRAIDECRLDVATDVAAATARVTGLARFDESRPLPSELGGARVLSLGDLKDALIALPDDLPPLPDGTTIHWSRDHLAYYYYDANTGAMAWERPIDASRSRPDDARRPPDDYFGRATTRDGYRGDDSPPRRRHRRWDERPDDRSVPRQPFRNGRRDDYARRRGPVDHSSYYERDGRARDRNPPPRDIRRPRGPPRDTFALL